MNQLNMFRLNIHFLIGVLACLGVGLVLVICFYAVIRAWIFDARQKGSLRRFRRRNVDEYGRSLPPAAQGICDRCGKVFEKVYFLPTGQKLCENCHEASAT